MTVDNVLAVLPAVCVAGRDGGAACISGGYVSDLLSNVMGKAAAGNVWITMQGHPNIIAVASLVGLAAVVVAGGVVPDAATVEKAEQEGIPLLVCETSSFDCVGRLYTLGIKGL